jgi:nucleotide-binding universal stress UspA family protein
LDDHRGVNPLVLVATDLTTYSEPALVRARAHAEATGGALVVCHVIPDVMRHHPLFASRDANDTVLAGDLVQKAAELVAEQVGRVLRLSVDDYRIIVETGRAEDEIVRISEEEHAWLVVIGAKPREGSERVLGHVAERVVRYAHCSVLIARAHKSTGKILVATDFTDGSTAALKLGGELATKLGVDGTLLHVVQLPSESSALSAVSSALGSPWIPPTQTAIESLESLGRSTLEGLAKQYGFTHVAQVEGTPAEVIVARAESLDAEMIMMGSRGRTGLARLVLGSTAEKVIRTSNTSVLVARTGHA